MHGLLPGTTYHFRAVAANRLGTSLGDDITFATTADTPPTLGNLAIVSGSFSFSFNNAPGLTFTVLGTTNVTLPFGQWQNLGHPMEGPAGQYQFTESQSATNSQRYYTIRRP